MEKALEKIKEIIDFCDAVGCHRAIYESIKFVEKELEEAMKPKKCDSCKTCEHYSSGKQSDNFGWEKCGWDWDCKRKYEDHYEPKETQC